MSDSKVENENIKDDVEKKTEYSSEKNKDSDNFSDDTINENRNLKTELDELKEKYNKLQEISFLLSSNNRMLQKAKDESVRNSQIHYITNMTEFVILSNNLLLNQSIEYFEIWKNSFLDRVELLKKELKSKGWSELEIKVDDQFDIKTQKVFNSVSNDNFENGKIIEVLNNSYFYNNDLLIPGLVTIIKNEKILSEDKIDKNEEK